MSGIVRDVRHDLARLGRRVRQRRYELGLTQRDAAVAGRVSDQTWVNVERGTKVSDRTLASVERSLRWQPGSAQAVAEGGEPVETGGSDRSLQERVAALEAELIALRDELATRQRT